MRAPTGSITRLRPERRGSRGCSIAGRDECAAPCSSRHPSERDVLLLATEGFTLVEIAEMRGRTKKTVWTQAASVAEKTGFDSIHLAALYLLGEAAALE